MEFSGAVWFDAQLGELWFPYVDATLRNGEYVTPCRLLVDSGTHITLLPLHLGLALGLRKDSDEPISGTAVGGANVLFRLRRVRLRIGNHEIAARVGWLLDDSTEALLGRLDVFDAFHFDFRQSERTLIVTPTR